MGKHSKPSKTKQRAATVGVASAVGLSVIGSGVANADTGVWDKVAQCESGGNWSINTGNGYYGGLQFLPSTWRAYGGTGMPHQASKAEQIRVAQKTLASQGPGAWPVCSKKAGLTRANGGGSVGSPTRSSAGATARQSTPKQRAPERSADRAAAPSGRHHKVVSGDTLSEIASANGTTVKQLMNNNKGKIRNANLIFVGQTVNL